MKYRIVEMKSGRFALQEMILGDCLNFRNESVGESYAPGLISSFRFDTKEAAQFWIDDQTVVEEYE